MTTPWHARIATPKFIQEARARVIRGGTLTMEEMFKLITSHEELRARALIARERVKGLERDRDAMLDAIRSGDAVKKASDDRKDGR